LVSTTTQIRGLTFFLIVIFLIFGSCGSGLAQSQPQVDLTGKSVLVLYSEDKAHPAHELTDRGIRSAFSSNKTIEVRLYNEYLDGSRFKDPAITHAFADYLRRKYTGVKIDAIIAVYWKAVNFLLKETADVFPDTPIVVTQLTRDHAETLEHSLWRHSITGTVFGDNITDFLASTFQLRPGTKRIALVGGTNPSEEYTEKLFRKGLEPHLEKLELIDLTRLPMQEILSRLGSLPPDTIVLFSNMFTDGAGQNFVPREALTLISRATNAPVFGLFDSYLGYGIVGGRLVSFEEHGKEAASITLRILAGESPAAIPFGGEQAYVNAYDWRQLRRWNMDEDALPQGSIVMNREATLWDFRYYIIGFLVFCILETALIFFLLIQKQRKKAAEEVSRQKTEELDQFFNVFLDILGIANKGGYFVRVNPAIEMILGYTREEFLSRPFFDFVHPDDQEMTREAFSALTSREKVISFENRYRCKDGTYRWLQWNSVPSGNLVYAAARDVTDRMQAEKALRESEEALRRRQRYIETVFENAPIGFAVHTIDDGVGRYVSARFEEIYGVQRGTINSHYTFFDRVWPNHPELREEIRRRVVADMASGDARRMHWENIPVPLRSGETRYITAINIPVLDQNLMVSTVQDVTEQKQAEEAIKESEAKYRSLYESMMDGYILAGMDGRILRFNDAYREMTGYSSDELTWLTYHDITPEKWHDAQQKIVEEQVLTRGYSEVYEKEYRKKDGTVFPVELRTFLLKGEKGDNIGMWAIVRDISSRKLIESEALKLREDLAHVTRVSTLGGLTTSLAHEINQPLAAILSNAQAAQRFLSQDNPDMKEIGEILGDIIRDDNRAAEVIRKIRSLLKKEEARYETLSLNDVIEEILNVIRNDSALAAVSIEKEFDPLLPPIWGDRIQLQQVILNLVLNAAEAMRDGGPEKRRLTVRTVRHDGRFAQVSIRDFGSGIQEHSMNQLFQPFYTTKSGGMGMGLAISQDIVKAHRGIIWGENNTDTGATFSFTVPFNEEVGP